VTAPLLVFHADFFLVCKPNECKYKYGDPEAYARARKCTPDPVVLVEKISNCSTKKRISSSDDKQNQQPHQHPNLSVCYYSVPALWAKSF
jgi:hypothetical protein